LTVLQFVFYGAVLLHVKLRPRQTSAYYTNCIKNNGLKSYVLAVAYC